MRGEDLDAMMRSRSLVRLCTTQMLFPHSGRHGFDNITPDVTVPTPDKAVRSILVKPACLCAKISDVHVQLHLYLSTGRLCDA